MPFKPLVHRCEIVEADGTLVFYVREPSGREVLLGVAEQRKERSPLEGAYELYSKYIVHEDGSKLSEDEVNELLDMRLSLMHKVSELVTDKIGLKQINEKK